MHWLQAWSRQIGTDFCSIVHTEYMGVVMQAESHDVVIAVASLSNPDHKDVKSLITNFSASPVLWKVSS